MTGHSTLCLRNRQQARRLNLSLLRRILRTLLAALVPTGSYELCCHFVGTEEMARLNERFLGHIGPTDVITFNHGAHDRAEAMDARDATRVLHGEIFVCPEMAVEQAVTYGTSWQSELARYCAHGLLHLCGYDDQTADVRRRMKREEDRLVAMLTARFPLSDLSART